MGPEIQTQLRLAVYAESLADTSRPPREDARGHYVLATVPATDGHLLGPLGGGRIHHGFLIKRYTAPLQFRPVERYEPSAPVHEFSTRTEGEQSVHANNIAAFFRFHTTADFSRMYVRTNANRGKVDLLSCTKSSAMA
ncbi:hypothetical protein BKA83DRAFT_4247351 [Pisolithus microcarpus]|nr:hypothetical protein BKA83DRAFT_4339166 [Pisolithus microcarpus]KAI6026739.1 hypothetical protein BKA83DRAFT_4247351 [Pisolithus microcarpus]